jgi:hypothetical protein
MPSRASNARAPVDAFGALHLALAQARAVRRHARARFLGPQGRQPPTSAHLRTRPAEHRAPGEAQRSGGPMDQPGLGLSLLNSHQLDLYGYSWR